MMQRLDHGRGFSVEVGHLGPQPTYTSAAGLIPTPCMLELDRSWRAQQPRLTLLNLLLILPISRKRPRMKVVRIREGPVVLAGHEWLRSMCANVICDLVISTR
jgi:hypothetical protein